MECNKAEQFDENYLKGYEYETLMNALHVSVFKCLLDENFTAIWCNNYFFESTGYTKEEYINLYHYSIRDYFSCMTDEYDQISVIVTEALQKGEHGFECVARMPQKGGKFIWIKVVGTFTNEIYNGIPVLYVVYTDITDVIEQQELSKRLKKHSEMLRAALDAAEQANHAKSDFLSRMSHDIRTPLNAIIGMTEIAEAHLDDPEKIHDCHRKIALSSQHLLGLINDVLDMSKIESGKMALNNSVISLPELLGNIVSIMQADIKVKKQSFVVYPYNLRFENIYSDALRLRQIFLNILSNASKFTPDGGKITFEIREVGRQSGGIVMVRFTFSDTGIGMRPEFLEHIFDTFTREQDSRVDKTEGSGLGMAITKKIVDILGGEITVSSQFGTGTTFEVTLPLVVADAPEVPLDQSELRGLHILLVDKDAYVCEYASSLFERIGLKGRCINDGMTAVREIVQAHKAGHAFDAVILEWNMHDLSGSQIVQEACAQLRERAPIFIAAAYDWDDVEKEALDPGVAGFLTKPLFRSNLCDGLNKYVLHRENLYCNIKKEKSFDFKGKRFLLAEDNELNREIAMELLSSTGVEIDTAADGLQCVEIFSRSPAGYYDLILMDIQMPVMNGYTATMRIRDLARKDAKTIQIWAMTADAFVEDVEKAKAVGMNGHFAKPLDIIAINAELSRFLT